MKGAGLTQSARFVCITLALGVHAAAAAFILAPAAEPPPPAPGVEIEMLAEITSEAAKEIAPAAAAESVVAEAAVETQPGEAKSAIGQLVNSVAPLNTEKTEVTPELAEEAEKPEHQPEAVETPEAKPTEEPVTVAAVEPTEVTAVDAPVELETPVVEAPQAPALAQKPKPAAKKVKKVKAQQRRGAVAGATLTTQATRKGTSQAQRSGGSQASSNYKSLVYGRIVARRSAIMSKVRRKRSHIVSIRFTIAPNGAVRAASVARSSGDPALDSDVRAIVASIDFPPPPSGAQTHWTVPIKLESR